MLYEVITKTLALLIMKEFLITLLCNIKGTMKKHYILWGMFLFACVCHVTAQSNSLLRYNISYLTMQNGLPHNFVDDIYKDSQGFLWISTAGGGLARYDGYEFVNFNTSNTSYNFV